jgi:hypothetical protein
MLSFKQRYLFINILNNNNNNNNKWILLYVDKIKVN